MMERILSAVKERLRDDTSLDYILDDEQYLRTSLRQQGGIGVASVDGSISVDDYIASFVSAYGHYNLQDPVPCVQIDDTIHRCPKCSSKKIQVSDAQLRATDEGSTLVKMCVQCGHLF